jgi:hypothetical protein
MVVTSPVRLQQQQRAHSFWQSSTHHDEQRGASQVHRDRVLCNADRALAHVVGLVKGACERAGGGCARCPGPSLHRLPLLAGLRGRWLLLLLLQQAQARWPRVVELQGPGRRAGAAGESSIARTWPAQIAASGGPNEHFSHRERVDLVECQRQCKLVGCVEHSHGVPKEAPGLQAALPLARLRDAALRLLGHSEELARFFTASLSLSRGLGSQRLAPLAPEGGQA